MPLQLHGQDVAASAPVTFPDHATSDPAPLDLAAPSSTSTASAAARWIGTGADAEPQACFVCMDAAADAVLIECGHGGLCAGALPPLAPARIPLHQQRAAHPAQCLAAPCPSPATVLSQDGVAGLEH